MTKLPSDNAAMRRLSLLVGGFNGGALNRSALGRGVAKGPATPGGEAKLAARALESLFVRQLVQAMGKTAPQGALFGKSMGSSIYKEMFMGAVAEQIDASGGIGLAAQLEAQLGALKGAGPSPAGAAAAAFSKVSNAKDSGSKGGHPAPELTARIAEATQRGLARASLGAARASAAAHRIAEPNTLSVGGGAAGGALASQIGVLRARQALGLNPSTPAQGPKRADRSAPARPGAAARLAAEGLRFEPPARPEPVVLADRDGKLQSPLGGPLAAATEGQLAMRAPGGTSILAAASGRVIEASGDHLVVEHGSRRTAYRGLGEVLGQVGDLVLRGQELAKIGASGTFRFGVTPATKPGR